MAGYLYIPQEVRDSIRKHLEIEVNIAEAAYGSVSEDEDAVTGYLFGRLETHRTIVVPVQGNEISGNWSWKIVCSKFRGRGDGAAEKTLGADGVIELSLNDYQRKTLLFQAKKGAGRDPALLHQCIKLSTWREAASVFYYSDEGYFVDNIDSALRRIRRPKGAPAAEELEKFLGAEFLDCRVGDTSLRFDARKKKLSWQNQEGRMVSLDFSVKHRARILVKEPSRGHLDSIQIDPSQLRENRMYFSEEHFFPLESRVSLSKLNSVKTQLALAYHQDGFVTITRDEREILDRRMQEAGAAFDKIKATFRK